MHCYCPQGLDHDDDDDNDDADNHNYDNGGGSNAYQLPHCIVIVLLNQNGDIIFCFIKTFVARVN